MRQRLIDAMAKKLKRRLEEEGELEKIKEFTSGTPEWHKIKKWLAGPIFNEHQISVIEREMAFRNMIGKIRGDMLEESIEQEKKTESPENEIEISDEFQQEEMPEQAELFNKNSPEIDVKIDRTKNEIRKERLRRRLASGEVDAVEYNDFLKAINKDSEPEHKDTPTEPFGFKRR